MLERPVIHPTAFLAPDADVFGRVRIGADCSIWFHAVLRAEESPIELGARTNVQDGCVLHTDRDFPIRIGDDVTVGHGAILHGCTVGENSLIGMGAIVLNGAVIGKNCIVGAGALVTQNTVVPDNTLVLGSPAKPIRTLTPTQAEENRKSALHYVEAAKTYREALAER